MTRRGRRASVALPLATTLLLATALLLAGCGLGGPGGNATLGLAVDLDDPDKPILVPVTGPIFVGQEFFVRLEVNEIQEADHIFVRILNDTGQGLQEIDELTQSVEPPWNVAIIPLTFIERGKWSISLIVNTRKITDVKLETVRR